MKTEKSKLRHSTRLSKINWVNLLEFSTRTLWEVAHGFTPHSEHRRFFVLGLTLCWRKSQQTHIWACVADRDHHRSPSLQQCSKEGGDYTTAGSHGQVLQEKESLCMHTQAEQQHLQCYLQGLRRTLRLWLKYDVIFVGRGIGRWQKR